MSVAEDTKVDDLRPTNYPNFRVASGGKGPPEPPQDTHDWLSECELGTTFVARHRNSKDVDYNQYFVIYKAEKVILLHWFLPDGKVLDYYVDPVRFSKMFPEYVILGVNRITEEPQQEAGSTDDGNPR